MRNVFNFLFLSQSASKVSCILLALLTLPGRAHWNMPGHAHPEVMLVGSSWCSCLALSRNLIDFSCWKFLPGYWHVETQSQLSLPFSAPKYKGINRSAYWHHYPRSLPFSGSNACTEFERHWVSWPKRVPTSLGIISVASSGSVGRKTKAHHCALDVHLPSFPLRLQSQLNWSFSGFNHQQVPICPSMGHLVSLADLWWRWAHSSLPYKHCKTVMTFSKYVGFGYENHWADSDKRVLKYLSPYIYNFQTLNFYSR